MFESKVGTLTLEEQERKYSRKPGTVVQDRYLSIGQAEVRMVFTPFKKSQPDKTKAS